jgi:acetyl coenzyme A synthetase (ADP forming)-like protein
MASPKALDAILRPGSIAVVGASRRENSIGWQIVDNLLEHGFTGSVYPVNPSAASIHSIKAYPSIADVPERVDLAVIVVPSHLVKGAARECADAGVRGLVVISAGFKEVGQKGAERERELLDILQDTGIRMVGPNCMGVINTHPDVRMDATFAPAMPPAGPVAFVSQSGAMGASILDHAESLGIGMSQFVSAGNKADVSGNDLIAYWKDDPAVKLVLMYLESFGEPSHFVELGRATTREKPIFIVKSGRTGVGARAAASHTGALGQTDLVTDALIAQAGAMRAQSINELFDLAMAFSKQPLPKGNRVAIVTNAGGPGIIIADACEANGLDVAALAPETQERLRGQLPDEASVRNPVDLIASATAGAYRYALQCVMEDPGVHGVIAAFVPPLGIYTQDVAEAIVSVSEQHPDRPLLAVLMGKQGLPAGMAELHEANIPGYIFPESAARALAAMWRYARKRQRPIGNFVSYETDDAAVEKIIDATIERGQLKLSEPDALRVLEAYGIDVVPWTFVERSGDPAFPDTVADAASRLGFPVAVKIVSPEISHKTDVGGVVLHLETGEDVSRTVKSMLQAVGGDVDGVVVQRMAASGRETIVGLTRVPRVGPMIMFGLGGVYVEVMRDVVLRLCPLHDADAMEMIGEVKMHKLLEGVRGEAPRDLAALAETVLRISQLAERHGRIMEMDINPLVSYETGALAIDTRIQLDGS